MLMIAVALPFIASTTGDRERQIMDLAILILTYIMLGWGLNIVVGLAGLLDLGYVAFYAVGAYTYALLATIYLPMWFGDGIIPWAFFITLPIAGVLAALWGVVLGFPVSDCVATILPSLHSPSARSSAWSCSIGWISLAVLRALARFRGHPFSACPSPPTKAASQPSLVLNPKPIYRIIWLYYIILALALLTNFVTIRLRNLPVGRAWEALREDEIACRSLGINTTSTSSQPSPLAPCLAVSPGRSLRPVRDSSV